VINSLNNINRLGSVAVTKCVSCEVRTGFLYIMQINFVFQIMQLDTKSENQNPAAPVSSPYF
jgi:hypothetical protein